MPARAGGSPKSPGERLPRSRGKQSASHLRHKAHALTLSLEPLGVKSCGVQGESGLGAAQGVGQSSGHGESRVEAETLPGAPADWGRRVLSCGEALTLGARPVRPPTNH